MRPLKKCIIYFFILTFITTFLIFHINKNKSFKVSITNNDYKGILYTKNDIERNFKKLSTKEINTFIELVEKSLNQDVITVADKVSLVDMRSKKEYKQYYEIMPDELKNNEYLYKHSYFSIGAYFNKSEYDEIWNYKDGEANAIWKDLRFYDTIKRNVLVDNLEILSFAYILGTVSDDKEIIKLGMRAGEKAAEWIKKWFLNEDTFMLPQMDYAAIKPGSSEPMAAQVITTVFLIYVLDAYYLIEDSGLFSLKESYNLKKWFKNYSNWLINDIRGQKECASRTNHGVWYDAQLITFLYFVGDKESYELAIEHLEKYSVDRFDAQIENDGSMPKELQRKKALHYTIFNLEAFITLAQAANKFDINLYCLKNRYNQEYIESAILYVLKESKIRTSEFYYYNWDKKFNYLALANKEYQNADIEEIIQMNYIKGSNILLKLKLNK